MTGDRCVFNFLQRTVDGKLLTRFQSENAVFKILRRSVDKAIFNTTFRILTVYYPFSPIQFHSFRSQDSELNKSIVHTQVYIHII